VSARTGIASKDTRLGIGLGLVSAVGFSLGPIFAISLYQLGFDWAPVLAWRFLLAALISWVAVLALPRSRTELLTIDHHRAGLLVFLGVLFVGSTSTYYAALVFVPASVAVLLVNLSPALVAIFSLRLGAPLRGIRAWTGLAVAVCGAALAVVGPEISLDPAGVVLATCSAVLYAVWAMFAARSAGERRGARAEGISSGPAVAVMFTSTAAILMLLVWTRGESLSLAGMTPEGAAYLIGFALVGSIVGIQASYASAARIGASRAAVFVTAEPIITIGLAAVFLDERLTLIQATGAVLVILGILLVRFDLRSLREICA
jgi:drug/metabolite transporter (DMT)-like permease